MSRSLSRMDRAAVLRVWGLILLATTLWLGVRVVAQEDDKEKAPKRAPSTLFVLVHVRNKQVRPDQIQGTFKAAAEILGDEKADIQVDPLEPQIYRTLQNMTTRLGNTRSGVTTAGKPYVRQKGSRGNKVEWELHLNSEPTEPGMFVREVDLILGGKDGQTTTHTIKPTSARDPNAEMAPTADPSVFIVRLDPAEAPQKFIVRGIQLKGRQPVEKEGEWGEADRYYIVLLRNLTASHQELLKLVQTEKVPNRLTDSVLGQDLTFVFASYGFKLPRTGTFDKNYYIPYLTGLADTSVARVWMLFPLKDEEAKAELAKYANQGVLELPQSIRKTQPLLAGAEDEPTVSEKTAARWIELTPDQTEKGFTRRIKLENVRALGRKFPVVRRLVVYEYQPTPKSTPQAQAVEDAGKLVLVVNEEIKEWPEGLAGMAGTVPAKTEKSGE